MKSKSALEIKQQDALEAFKIFKSVCDKESITYYLLAGSCLGAVRHKGFIPWDDDIDVGLTIENYQKLIEVFSAALEGTAFRFECPENNENFPRMIGKVIKDGLVLIDVFKIIPVPEDLKAQKVQWKKKRYLNAFRMRKTWAPAGFDTKKEELNYKIKGAILKPFIAPISVRWLTKQLFKLEVQVDESSTNLFSNFYSIYSMEKETIKKEWLEGPSLVEFEGLQCTTVSKVDPYLRKLYGEYMTLPPVQERHPRHDFNRFE